MTDAHIDLTTSMARVTDEDLMREMEHEKRMFAQGIARATERQVREAGRGNGSTNPGGRGLLKGIVAPLASIIEEEIERLANGAVKRKPPELRSLQLLPPADYAAIALRTILDKLCGRLADDNNTFMSMNKAVGQAISHECQVRALHREDKPLYEHIFKRVRSRTSSSARLTQEMLMAYRRVREDAADPLTTAEKMRLGAFIVTALERLNVVVTKTTFKTPTKSVKTVDLSDASWDIILKLDARAAEMKPALLPTLIPPRHWEGDNDGGYWLSPNDNTLWRARCPSNITKGMNADTTPGVFRPLNYLQAVPFRVNRRVLEVALRMKDTGMHCEGFPSFEMETVPPVPANIATDDEARKAWRAEARGVHNRNNAKKVKVLATMRTVSSALEMRDAPEIYFPKGIDFRGRVYDAPQFLKPQGDDLSKGLLEFANGKPLGEMGAYWLAIHLANTWGEDKVSFDDRQKWVAANEDRILAIAEDPFADRMWMDADAPFQFLAACFEWSGYRTSGVSHTSHIVVGLDGSCNGLQHLSAVLRDSVGGAAVNLLPASKPQDIYTEVLKKVVAALEKRAEQGEPTAQKWLPLMSRSVVKRPVMTLPYGATQQGFAEQIMEDTLNAHEKAGTSPFGKNGFEACRYLGAIVWEATGETVIAARAVMDWLQEVAKVVSEASVPLSWVAPTGLRVTQRYKVPKTRVIELLAVGQRITMKIAEGQYENKADRKKMVRSIAPNFVHSMDAAHMLRTVDLLLDTYGPSIHLAMVHDSFGCHACDADVMARALRQAFVQMYHEKDWLEAFRDEVASQVGPALAKKLPPVPPRGSLHLSEVINSLYFFA